MIGIIGAMAVEIEKITALIQKKKEKTISGIKFVSGFIGKSEVITAVCGVGKVFAAVCTQTMILEYQPEFIINVGVAGGIAQCVKIGDIAVAGDVVQHDMDTSALGDPVGMISGIDEIYIPTDESITRSISLSIKEIGINTVTGTIVSGDQFINNSEKKEYLRKAFSAVACEMEGAAIGHVCHINSVPFVVIRAISDVADDSSSMDFMKFVNTAADNSAKVIKHFLTK